jgi:hypothetical protein
MQTISNAVQDHMGPMPGEYTSWLVRQSLNE